VGRGAFRQAVSLGRACRRSELKALRCGAGPFISGRALLSSGAQPLARAFPARPRRPHHHHSPAHTGTHWPRWHSLFIAPIHAQCARGAQPAQPVADRRRRLGDERARPETSPRRTSMRACAELAPGRQRQSPLPAVVVLPLAMIRTDAAQAVAEGELLDLI
jgi:hypothetical protein